jgi:SAM-dependent methyltransferase
MTQPETEPFTKSLERMNLFQEPEARVLIADLGLPEGSRGLDVGCGAGLFAVWLAEAIGSKGRVVGVGSGRFDEGRRLGGRQGPFASRLEFREGDATKLEAPDARLIGSGRRRAPAHPGNGRALGEFARRPPGRSDRREGVAAPARVSPARPSPSSVVRRDGWSRHEGGEFSFEERQRTRLARAADCR